MYTLPDVGLSSPPIMLKKVVLPEPDGPMMDKYSPRRTSSVTPRSACVSESPMVKTLRTSTARMTQPAFEASASPRHSSSSISGEQRITPYS
jgi:hypothetical protein